MFYILENIFTFALKFRNYISEFKLSSHETESFASVQIQEGRDNHVPPVSGNMYLAAAWAVRMRLSEGSGTGSL